MENVQKHSETIPDCQCNGPGHCPVYNTHMTQASYKKCKHNRLWRKDSLRFFNIVNSSEFQAEIEKTSNYQNKIEWEKSYMEAAIEQKKQTDEAMLAAEQAYIATRKKQEQDYLATLTPEQQKEYHIKKEEAIAYERSQQLVNYELNEVISTMAQEGITPENYEEKKEGLGDAISNALSKIGLTTDAVETLLGTHGGCGCDKRKKFLNKILPFTRKKE